MFILYKNIHTKKRQRKLKILYVHFLYVHVSLSQIPNPIGLFDTFFVIAATQPFSKDDVCYNSPPHLFWPIGVGHMMSDFVWRHLTIISNSGKARQSGHFFLYAANFLNKRIEKK